MQFNCRYPLCDKFLLTLFALLSLIYFCCFLYCFLCFFLFLLSFFVSFSRLPGHTHKKCDGRVCLFNFFASYASAGTGWGVAVTAIIKPTRKWLPAHLPRASNYDKRQVATRFLPTAQPVPPPSAADVSAAGAVVMCCMLPARGTEQRTVNYGLQHLQPPG